MVRKVKSKITKKKTKPVKRKSKAKFMPEVTVKPVSQKNRDTYNEAQAKRLAIAREQLIELKANPPKCPRCHIPGEYKGDEYLKTIGKSKADGNTVPYYAYFICRQCSLRYQETLDPKNRQASDNKFYHSAKPKLWEPVTN